MGKKKAYKDRLQMMNENIDRADKYFDYIFDRFEKGEVDIKEVLSAMGWLIKAVAEKHKTAVAEIAKRVNSDDIKMKNSEAKSNVRFCESDKIHLQSESGWIQLDKPKNGYWSYMSE